MTTDGDDFERLSGAVVLSRLSDSSKEKDDSDDSLELLYTGMDASELDEVIICLIAMLVMNLEGETKA